VVLAKKSNKGLFHPAAKNPLIATLLSTVALLLFASCGGQEDPGAGSGNYFSPDYVTARSRFRQAVEKADGRLTALKLDAKSPGGENLTIDIAWFGAERPRRAVLHSSGIHGVEASAGSAIQLQLLDQGLPSIPADSAIVLVHVLNPYGMAWLRRFNEESVDLNRNFLGPDERYEGAPQDYEKFDSFLNPPGPPSWDFYHLRAAWLVARYGMPKVKQIVAGGQHVNPKGLFFGGKRLQQGPQLFQDYVAEHLATAERLVAIDVHTGLGPFAVDSLLVEPDQEDTPIYQEIRAAYGDRVAPSDPDRSVAYRVRGSHGGVYRRTLPSAKVYFVLQEFGTYSATKVLYAMREENRWHHYGDGSVDHPTKHKLKETFYPDSDTWRQRVLHRGKEVLRQATELAFQG
jgi:hypothetical protein